MPLFVLSHSWAPSSEADLYDRHRQSILPGLALRTRDAQASASQVAAWTPHHTAAPERDRTTDPR
ncbi:hypothetical protein ASD51_22415 [Streptomyces sp. Root55]|nr:hypothetical protein ASD26_14910 [Streptomyces sp. Root1319]KQZ03163.1 hypothetical protein ASD51_22415 [Streptomyces sp. Root55]